jgi:hypothetical protein
LAPLLARPAVRVLWTILATTITLNIVAAMPPNQHSGSIVPLYGPVGVAGSAAMVVATVMVLALLVHDDLGDSDAARPTNGGHPRLRQVWQPARQYVSSSRTLLTNESLRAGVGLSKLEHRDRGCRGACGPTQRGRTTTVGEPGTVGRLHDVGRGGAERTQVCAPSRAAHRRAATIVPSCQGPPTPNPLSPSSSPP